MRNLVAKHSFNKGGVHRDKKKDMKPEIEDVVFCPNCGQVATNVRNNMYSCSTCLIAWEEQ